MERPRLNTCESFEQAHVATENLLRSLLGKDLSHELIDGTHVIESDDLKLSYAEDDSVFEIRDIEVFQKGTGLGSLVVSTLVSHAESEGMEIIASNVEDEAIGFWENQGFQQGSTPGEFFVA